jgi:polyketide synthase 2
LHLVQFLTDRNVITKLWLVTQGVQPVGAKSNIAIAQASIVGFGRTLMNECPALSCRLVDVGPGDPNRSARHVCSEIERADQETEVAWRGQTRFASRVVRTNLERHPPCGPISHRPGYRLEIPASGVMDQLAVVAMARSRPRPDEIEIEVRAAALNFRDVMKSLGIYPMDSDHELLLGDECSGRVVAVGANVLRVTCVGRCGLRHSEACRTQLRAGDDGADCVHDRLVCTP